MINISYQIVIINETPKNKIEGIDHLYVWMVAEEGHGQLYFSVLLPFLFGMLFFEFVGKHLMLLSNPRLIAPFASCTPSATKNKVN